MRALKHRLFVLIATLLLATTGHAEVFGTANPVAANPGPLSRTFSIYTGPQGELLDQTSWSVAQAVELPFWYHDIAISSISLGVMPGTEPLLTVLGHSYLPNTNSGSWLTFDLQGLQLPTTRFVMSIRTARPYSFQASDPIDFRLLATDAPAVHEGAHLLGIGYGAPGPSYVHIASPYSLMYAVDFTASSTPVPEPSAIVLICLGMGLLWSRGAAGHHRLPALQAFRRTALR